GQKLTTPGLALVWTPKGGLLVSGTGSQITPHDPGSLSAGKPLPGAGAVLSLSADGTALFGLSGGQVTHWDVDKGSIVRTFPIAEYVTLACGPAAVVLVQGTTPTLWDPIAGKRIGALDGHSGAITALGWTPNGKALAVAAADNKVRVYEPATAKLLRTLTAPAYVTGLALAVDGKIACVTNDKKVTIWPAPGGESRHTLPGHKDPPRGLAWSRDGRLLATGDKKDIFIWSAETGKQVKAIDHPRDVYSLVWSNDGTRLFVGSSEDVALTAYQAS